jgi:hypothetical protein
MIWTPSTYRPRIKTLPEGCEVLGMAVYLAEIFKFVTTDPGEEGAEVGG